MQVRQQIWTALEYTETQILQKLNHILYLYSIISLKFCLHLYKGKIIDLFYTIFLLTIEQPDVRVSSKTCAMCLLDAWNATKMFKWESHKDCQNHTFRTIKIFCSDLKHLSIKLNLPPIIISVIKNNTAKLFMIFFKWESQLRIMLMKYSECNASW